jgi:predicted transposase/invertase (TIGR01784 family)
MKTDSLFYHIFLNAPQIFFELIDQPETETHNYEFTSREIKQLSFRLDGLFLPLKEDQNQPFYLVEVQFQPDDELYYRLWGELMLFLRQYKPPYPWRVVAIYPSRNIEREATLHFGSLLRLDEVTRIYLDELETETLGVKTVKLVIEPESQVVGKARSLINQAKETLSNPTIQNDFIDLIETIIVYKLPKKSREEIETMLGLNSIKETKVYQEAFDEGQEIGKQIGQEIGKQIGREEGEQIGQQQAKLALIPILIQEGLTLKKIAKMLDLPLAIVKKAATKN